MYLHLGQDSVVPEKNVIAVFDLDNTSQSYLTRDFLKKAEKKGHVITVSDDLPKSFVVVSEKGESRVYLSQLAPATLQKRAEAGFLE